MWTMYDAPSDRDYQGQFNPEEDEMLPDRESNAGPIQRMADGRCDEWFDPRPDNDSEMEDDGDDT